VFGFLCNVGPLVTTTERRKKKGNAYENEERNDLLVQAKVGERGKSSALSQFECSASSKSPDQEKIAGKGGVQVDGEI